MGDARAKFTCDIIGLDCTICEIPQNALVVFPSEIVGNHRSKQDQSQ